MKQTLKSWGQEQAEPEDEINNNLKTKEGTNDVRPTNPSTNVNILASANNDKQASYNFVTFNELTQMQKSKYFFNEKKSCRECLNIKFNIRIDALFDWCLILLFRFYWRKKSGFRK
jgi:hypothetical protein